MRMAPADGGTRRPASTAMASSGTLFYSYQASQGQTQQPESCLPAPPDHWPQTPANSSHQSLQPVSMLPSPARPSKHCHVCKQASWPREPAQFSRCVRKGCRGMRGPTSIREASKIHISQAGRAEVCRPQIYAALSSPLEHEEGWILMIRNTSPCVDL